MRDDLRESGKVKALLLVVVLLVAAGGAAAFYLMDTGSDADPEAVATDESSLSPSPSSSGSSSPVESYKWGEVVLEVDRRPEGINVYFVNEGRVTFIDVALSCVERYRKDFESVACYGFPSLEAFETAEVDPESGGMENKCWQAYYSVSGRGKDEKTSAGAIDNGQASDQGCPTT